MKQYLITNKDGIELEVTESELYKIAEHWIDDWNSIEHDYAESNGENLEERLYDYPNGFDQVKEIMNEYMQCELEELEEVEKTDTLEMYHSLLG